MNNTMNYEKMKFLDIFKLPSSLGNYCISVYKTQFFPFKTIVKIAMYLIHHEVMMKMM
jgi:hypothetical protein